MALADLNEIELPTDASESTERGAAVRLLGELRHAIDHGDLTVFYQPKFDLRTGDVVGVEALVRWPHPKRGLLGPAHFLPLVRKRGLMRAVTDIVLTQALDDVAEWHALGIGVPIAVNVFAPSLGDLDLPTHIASALAIRNLNPEDLTIEITEDFLLDNIERTRSVLERLRQRGIRIAIDDFGSGYSALWYLRELAIDEVKLDRHFIAPIRVDARAAAVVRGVVDLAHVLGVTTVAEGVENAETAERLREFGCDVAQGYYYSPPVSAAAMMNLLASGRRSAWRAPSSRSSELRACRDQSQRNRVDAVPLVGGRRIALALEYMAEMAVAVGAEHLDAGHAHRVVASQDDRVRIRRIEERRPAAMGFELLGAAEQLGAARPALIDPFGLGVGVLADEGPLGARFAQHREFGRGELLTPLVVCEFQLGPRRGHASTLASVFFSVIQSGSMPSSSLPSALASR